MTKGHISRRQFVESTLATTAMCMIPRPSQANQHERILGSNNRISVGIAGMGERGTSLARWIGRRSESDNVELTAICDIWNQRRKVAAESVEYRTKHKPRVCRTFAELCDLKDVDVVVIATPDFQHAPLTRRAVEAGKDIYVEKPFGCDFEQIKQARNAVKKSDRIVQAGTQQRAKGIPWAIREFVQNGKLGKVSYVEIVQSLFQQRWRIPGSESALTEADTNWAEFLCYTPKVPFNARHYVEFRLFWPYSTGIFCQWMSHMIDLVNLVLGDRPKSVVAAGGTYVWHDGRTNPDTVQCLFEYPSGCLVSYHMRLGNSAGPSRFKFFGTKGTLDLNAGLAYGDGGGGEVIVKQPVTTIPEFITDASRRLPDREKGGVILKAEPDIDHMSDFFQAVRSRRQPRANINAAFNHALATTMAGMSWRMGTRIQYDPVADEVKPKEEKKVSEGESGGVERVLRVENGE